VDPVTGALLLDEMGYASPSLAVCIGACSFPYMFAMLSEEPEMQDLVRKFCNDTEAKLTGCWAITEPDHGSDVLYIEGEHSKDPRSAPQVRAVLDGDHYVINGQKAAWVSNGTFASHAALFLSLDPSKGSEGGGIATIPLDLPGITRGKPLDKMGQRALNQGEIFFDNVRLPRSYMICEDTETYTSMLNMILTRANAGMGLLFAGTARAAFDEGLRYAKERVQGGKVIFEHQSIKLKLFNAYRQIEAARALLWKASWLASSGTPHLPTAMAARTMATDMAIQVTSDMVQVFGGYGISKEHPVEKFYRDAKLLQIMDGTNEMVALKAAEQL
jgi:alkylation response protein AidB-like acyl-CoA dehydrogenase